MGNRAVITTPAGWNRKDNELGIYLHWNGGRDSVEAFLTYCKLKGYRSPDKDNYGWAALATVISNFFGASGMSVGIDVVSRLDCDNYDNGVYIIAGWEIIGRKHFENRREQMQYDLKEFLLDIDSCMPEEARLGEDFLNASTVPTTDVKIGDIVFVQDTFGGKCEKHKVIGFGSDGWVNGTNVKGMPYVDKYGAPEFAGNINNYIRTEEVRVFKQKDIEEE